MNAAELRYQHELNHPDSKFFSRSIMKFFGDTMANYGVVEHEVCYELYRRKPVKHGVDKSAYFSKETFAQTWL